MHCKNCNTSIGSSQNYCHECGAKIIYNRLSPKIIAQQINDQFISIDNKLLQTFICLFTKPEDVIDGYINGRRKKYIEVLQYFAISLSLAGLQVFLMLTFFKESLDVSFVPDIGDPSFQDKNPLKDFTFENFMNYQGLIYILSVPVYAFATWFVYYILKDRRYNFTEHVVLNLYYSAQIIIITAICSILFLILGIDYVIASMLLLLPSFAYLYYILKRLFKDEFWETVAKFSLVTTVYFTLYFLFSVMLIILGFLFGYFFLR